MLLKTSFLDSVNISIKHRLASLSTQYGINTMDQEFKTDTMPKTYNSLFNFAKKLEIDWSEDGASIDWDDAASLISQIKDMKSSDRARHQALTNILVYTHCVEDWDSGAVGNWPQCIMSCLTMDIKRYGYALTDEEKFEVYKVPLSGNSILVGLIEKEEIASVLVAELNDPDPIDPLDPIVTMADQVKEKNESLEERFSYVTVELVALTRKEASVTVLVPDDALADGDDELLSHIWDKADGSEFSEDREYWEKSELTRIDNS